MWKVYFSNNFKKEHRELTGLTSFYLLPSIEYFRDTTFDDYGDCSFDISFNWLFWSITFTRYWGEIYESKK